MYITWCMTWTIVRNLDPWSDVMEPLLPKTKRFHYRKKLQITPLEQWVVKAVLGSGESGNTGVSQQCNLW